MRVKLSEDPRDWRRFALQACGLLLVLLVVLTWRHALSRRMLVELAILLAGAATVAWLRPRWCRGPYRLGMTASARLGDIMGRITLTVLFFVLFVPLGLVLRAFGHDPLQLRRTPRATTYWRRAGKTGHLTEMY